MSEVHGYHHKDGIGQVSARARMSFGKGASLATDSALKQRRPTWHSSGRSPADTDLAHDVEGTANQQPSSGSEERGH